MSKAVMQQALDAINGGLYRSDSIIKAISALEAALAQPEQENECNPYDLCAGCRCAYSRLAQPEQDAGKCGCGANLYIDESGKPCSKAQPEHPLDKKADNARELGLDYGTHKTMKTGDIINCAASGGIKPITPGGGGPGSGSGGRTYYVGIYEGEIGCENTDQKREWVGLTPLEKRNMFKDIDWDTEDWGYLAYASQIEARLKELNGYT